MRVVVFYILFLSTCAYAFWRGGPDERRGAWIFILGVIASLIAMANVTQRWHQFEPGLAAVDLAIFLAYLWLALRSDKYWPLGMAGLALAVMGGHALRLVMPGLPAWQYWLGSVVWSWGMVLTLLGGIIRHHRRNLPGPG